MSDIIEPQNPSLSVPREVVVTSPEHPLPNSRITYVDDTPVIVRQGSEFPIADRSRYIAVMTMAVISFLTFWLPFFGPLLAGAIGGFYARYWAKAFGSAAVVAVVVPLVLFVLHFFTKTDNLAFLMNLSFSTWFVLHAVGLFIGVASGVLSRPRSERGLVERELWVE
jgi:hypothetical protein